MDGQLVQVGVRELRQGLADYLDSDIPVAITRHGQTIGYYVPVQRRAHEQELLALTQAIERLQALIQEFGIDEDEVVRDFRNRRGQT